jgi:hypothetical protein
MGFDAWTKDFSKILDNLADAFSKILDNLADASNSNQDIQVSANTNVIGAGVGNTVDDIFIDQSQNNFTFQFADNNATHRMALGDVNDYHRPAHWMELGDVDDYHRSGYHFGDNLADASNFNQDIQVSANTNVIGAGVGNTVDDIFIDQSQHNFTFQFAHAFA